MHFVSIFSSRAKRCKTLYWRRPKEREDREKELQFGVPLWPLKEGGKLRGVVDHRALNKITKRNNAPILRTDQMLDEIGGSNGFSKTKSIKGFRQIGKVQIKLRKRLQFKVRSIWVSCQVHGSLPCTGEVSDINERSLPWLHWRICCSVYRWNSNPQEWQGNSLSTSKEYYQYFMKLICMPL